MQQIDLGKPPEPVGLNGKEFRFKRPTLGRMFEIQPDKLREEYNAIEWGKLYGDAAVQARARRFWKRICFLMFAFNGLDGLLARLGILPKALRFDNLTEKQFVELAQLFFEFSAGTRPKAETPAESLAAS